MIFTLSGKLLKPWISSSLNTIVLLFLYHAQQLQGLFGGMLLGGLSGLPAICGTLALMLWSLAYRWMSVGMVVMQLIAAPLAIITMMSLAKLVISASTTLVRSKRGKNAFYLIAMIVFIVLCQLPNIIDNPPIPAVCMIFRH